MAKKTLKELAEKNILNLQEHGCHLSRWGFIAHERKAAAKASTTTDDICYASLSNDIHRLSLGRHAFFSVYNGIHHGYLAGKHSEFRTSRQSGKINFVYNEASLAWARYLIGENSPWVNVAKRVSERDPEWINKYGFYFDDITGLPGAELYNFLIATRHPWEFPCQFWQYMKFREDMTETEAAFLGCLVQPHAGKYVRSDIGGDWHCHLWKSDMSQYVSRYILQKPRKLNDEIVPGRDVRMGLGLEVFAGDSFHLPEEYFTIQEVLTHVRENI